MANSIAILVRFTGRVQGVGFRFETARIAHDLPVTGYVRNEPDGSVELLVEGSPEAARQLLEEIQASRLGPLIRRMNSESIPPAGHYNVFSIVRS